MTNLEMAVNQIFRARRYMLNHINDDDWFVQPESVATHVAWQVGHLAVAQYETALRGVRGERSYDTQLIPAAFRDLYGRGSVPVPDKFA